MKKQQSFIILFFLVILLVACGSSYKKKSLTRIDKLIPINFVDTNYVDVSEYVNDTITADGWCINYFVKNDSTRYDDIFIECSKGKTKGQFYGADLLQMRRYFIPMFEKETSSNLYFTHGCATDCAAVLVFSKKTGQFKDYESVVDYNLDLEQLLYIYDNTNENENYDLALVELLKQKTHKIKFTNICGAPNKSTCIDSVIFAANKLILKTTLRKSFSSEKEIKETTTINLR
jgi:hypothetical protein